MNLVLGVNPPLHRRFNEQESLKFIRNRYDNIRKRILRQIGALQNDLEFRKLCQQYYAIGYKDWVLLSAVMNSMLNRKAQEFRIDMRGPDDMKRFLALQEKLADVEYPSGSFSKKEMDLQIQIFNVTVLKTYGFQFRRIDLRPDVIENFLRVRMKHFEIDFSHTPMFGEPPGDWPKI